MKIKSTLCNEFNITQKQAENIISLIDGGNTIPFIARYRKEMTGSLDDQVLRKIDERLKYLRAIDKRRDEVKELISAVGTLTDEISLAIDNATTLSEIDDIYRPYRPKRKTRASIAKEKGLEPLADLIFEQNVSVTNIAKLAEPYISVELGVANTDEAIAGACDIIAERLSDDATIRRRLRTRFHSSGMVATKGAKQEDSVYRLYYSFSEPISKIAPHRVLAIDRGEREGFLKVSIDMDADSALDVLYRAAVKNQSLLGKLVATAAEDAYSRLIFPSIEREIRAELTANAAESAIKVFGVNLKQLLMQPPVRGSVALGLDPAYRTGCKFAIVDETGRVLDVGVIYPVAPHNKKAEAIEILSKLIKKYNVSVISIGNGTASHETEVFAAELISQIDHNVAYMVVSEAGASVYSASKLAAEELPEYDVSLRSAVSIARRLQDPLAELVKIDPKAIGVGQYQHDMPPKRMDEALSGVVEDCVNNVGVDLNTASAPLLQKVSGINSPVAKEIVRFREENGAFLARAQLKKVPKLGAKAFEQCAGFLRVSGGKNILDATSVHPESYKAAEALLKLCNYSLKDVQNSKIGELQKRVDDMGKSVVAEKLGIGIPTLKDIIAELLRPGRDPRDELPPPLLRTDIMSIEDLRPNMELTGTVRNVVDFGAFIDIGVHQDGLVHISEICDRFIKHPSEVLKVGDIVKVYVTSVDIDKKRIGLSMKVLVL